MPRIKRMPFYFFMLDVQKKHAERGQRYSLKEMPEIAGPLWTGMSKEDKKPYEERAKAHNASQSSASSSGYNIKTCHGIDYTEIQKEQRQVASEQQQMKRGVSEMISKAILSKKIATMSFFVIHINYFCEYKGSEGEQKFDAAELAILEFSLADGIGRGMHTTIKLDCLPYGFTFEAQRHTEETHLLPLPPRTMGNTSIRDAVIEVIRFVNYNDEDMGSPVFTFDDHIPVVKSVFQDVLSKKSGGDNSMKINVFSLSELLFHLKNATMEHATVRTNTIPFASVYLAESYLERGTFAFCEGLPCDFHQEIDRVQHCSQTKIRVWAYSIIHYCARDLGIEFIQGKHAPMDSLEVPQFKLPDPPESVFTAATDFASEVGQSSYSHVTRYTTPGSNTGPGSIASSSRAFSDDFPQLSDHFKRRGKGRGNLV